MSIPLLVLQWTATMEEHPSEEVSAVEEDETWMTPLIRYLEADTLPGYCSEARKIKNQGARYCISQEKLYRRYFSGPYLRVAQTRQMFSYGWRLLTVRLSTYFDTRLSFELSFQCHRSQVNRHPVAKVMPV
ncbi:hypothetical protein F2Q70_00022757 [Brassica cretica]|uniref:Uncharacterized protein n=1 Tax=Brassica cretica TaxID=69181 RepID=A0A8S9GSQ1_BRACR|nr:hypothetical protein F2Q70_00022757 [Brassica cretica]